MNGSSPMTQVRQYLLLVVMAGLAVQTPVKGSYLSTELRQDAPS